MPSRNQRYAVFGCTPCSSAHSLKFTLAPYRSLTGQQLATPGPIDGNIRMAAGILEITAGQRDTTSVLVEALDDSDSSADAVRDTKVEMRGNQLYVGVPERSGWRMFSKARLRVVIELPLDLKINTASGSVRIGVAAGTGVWLDLNTASGRTTSDLAMHGTPPADAEAATLTIKARTASGDIALRRIVAA